VPPGSLLRVGVEEGRLDISVGAPADGAAAEQESEIVGSEAN
jgi:hypothetical protein